jgi:outer membrane protein assembly factor BamB
MIMQLEKIVPRFCLRIIFWHSLLVVTLLRAGDWPQYRGPNHDGISLETIRTNWSEAAPRPVWTVPLDPALSSLAVGGGRVFTQVRRRLSDQDQEFCVALDAATGQELWVSAPLDIADYPNGGVGPDDGPRSTPSVDGDRVYVLTSYLRMVCLDAATGQEIWSKDLQAEFGGSVIAWQNAASPLIEDDRVFVNGNGQNQRLLALRKQDGSVAWKGQNDGMTHATPVAATLGGVRQILYFAQSGLVSVAPDTGSVLWRFPLNYNSTSVAASPIVAGDLVYGSRAYPSSLSAAKAGAVVVRVANPAGSFSASQVWYKTNQLMNHWCTPVHYNGHLYGMYGQGLLEFKCVHLATGDQKWSVTGFGYGSVLAVDRYILALSESGKLVLLDPNPNAYTELARYQALDGSHSSIPGLYVKCWNVPAVSNGRIYIRSTTEAVCLDVAPKVRPRLKLQPGLWVENNAIQLWIASEDGSPLDTNRVSNIVVFAAADLLGGASAWIQLTNTMVMTNGQFRLDDSLGASQRFYRVEERP